MNNLKLQILNMPGSSIFQVHLEGALCGMDAIDLKKTLLENSELYNKGMELNLSAVNQLDLGGLNTLVTAYMSMRRSGYSMQLLVPQTGPIPELISLAKMNHILPMKKVASS